MVWIGRSQTIANHRGLGTENFEKSQSVSDVVWVEMIRGSEAELMIKTLQCDKSADTKIGQAVKLVISRLKQSWSEPDD